MNNNLCTSVVVSPLNADQLIVLAADPLFGHIRVEQTRMIINDRGWLEPLKITALVHGKVEDLKKFGWKPGQELKGDIIIKESTTPFNKKNPDKDLKVAGETKIACKQNGSPIYRKYYYFPVNGADQLVPHDNSGEIAAAFKLIKEAKANSNTAPIGKM